MHPYCRIHIANILNYLLGVVPFILEKTCLQPLII